MQWIHTQHTAIMTFTTTPICIKQCKVKPINKSMSSRAWTAHARACVHYAKTGGAWKSTNGQPSGTETKVLCAPTGCSCCTLLYAAHSSLWITEPVRTCCWMMGSRVWAERLGTIHMTPRAGEWLVSQSPKTHTSLDVALPRWFFGLWRNRLSTICTTTKHHKRVMVEVPPAAQITTVLVYLDGSLLVDLSLFNSILHWVLPCPPVHENYPLPELQARLLKECAGAE